MDLPLTNDLIFLNQEPQKRVHKRPCLLFLFTLTTLLAGLLLLDLVVKDRQGSKSKLILLEEHFLLSEKPFSPSSSEEPEVAVVPEYTTVFSEEYDTQVWEEADAFQVDVEEQSKGDVSHETVGGPEVTSDLHTDKEKDEESEDLQSKRDLVSTGARTEKGVVLDDGVLEDAPLGGLTGGLADPEGKDDQRGEEEIGSQTGSEFLVGGFEVHRVSSDLQSERKIESGFSASLMDEGEAMLEDRSNLFAEEDDALGGIDDPQTGEVVISVDSMGIESGGVIGPAISAPDDKWVFETGEVVAKENAAFKTSDATMINDISMGTSGEESQTCYDIARRISEPYTQEYVPSKGQVNISRTVWADYNWPGVITEESIGHAQATGIYKSFKIIDGKLYGASSNHMMISEEESKRMQTFVNAVLLAMRLFDIPDVDFIVDLGDYQRASTNPALHFAFDMSLDNPMGFTVPDPAAIEGALGPIQLRVLFECLDQHYPAVDRPMTVLVNSKNTSRYTQYLTQEARSHLRAFNYKVCSQGDCGLIASDQEEAASVGSIVQDKPSSAEDLNQFAFVVDADEDGDRIKFSDLLKQDTPVLKQDTRFPGYFWSHVIEDRPVQIFRRDGSDFFETLENAVSLRSINPDFYHWAEVDKMRMFSTKHLSHVGIARATAYSLTVYASKIQWIPKLEPGYAEISPEKLQIDTLPEGFKHRKEA